MSDGSEFHRSDAATGKERRPTDGWMDGWMDGISVSGLYYVAQLTADTVKTLFHPYCGGLRLIL